MGLYGNGLTYPSSPVGLVLGNNASPIPINSAIMFVDEDCYADDKNGIAVQLEKSTGGKHWNVGYPSSPNTHTVVKAVYHGPPILQGINILALSERLNRR